MRPEQPLPHIFVFGSLQASGHIEKALLPQVGRFKGVTVRKFMFPQNCSSVNRGGFINRVAQALYTSNHRKPRSLQWRPIRSSCSSGRRRPPATSM